MLKPPRRSEWANMPGLTNAVTNRVPYYNHEKFNLNVEWSTIVNNIQMCEDAQTNDNNLVQIFKGSVMAFDAIHPHLKDFHWIGSTFKEAHGYSNYNVHVYTNFSTLADGFTRHKDNHDVLIVGGIGSAKFILDDYGTFDILPGGYLFIPAGTYHYCKPLTPRSIISIGFF